MIFWKFNTVGTDSLIPIQGEFNITLVFLSLAVAALATYSSFIILERIWGSSNTKTLNIWLWFGSTVFGIGVWAMHFTGMLAFMIPVPMSFDPLITFLSTIPPIFGSYVALRILALRLFDFWRLQLGALALAVGIGTMHFVGMEAMEMQVRMVYDIYLFLGSIVVAHILATIALYIRVLVNTTEESPINSRMLSAFMMGCAIAGMHYTAMASVTYLIEPTIHTEHAMSSSSSIFLALAIMAVVAIFVGVTVIGVILDRRLQTAEDTAVESETRERTILETLADGLLVVDTNGCIETSNSTAELMFGYSNESMIGISIKSLMPGMDYQILVDDLTCGKKDIVGKTIELEGLKSNAKKIPLEVTFAEMKISSALMFNAVVRDVTERKRLEEQLRHSQKLESIGQLAAGIAHEINTPTQYVSDNTAFLKDIFPSIMDALKQSSNIANLPEKDISTTELETLKKALEEAEVDFISQEVPKAIDQSLYGLERISTIVSAMKSFSHASNGDKKEVDIKEAIETTVTVAQSEWRYVAHVNCEFEPDLPLVPCLRDEFNQVILNIIVNAAHAIDDDLKSTGREKGLISINVKSNDEFILIDITDDGAGMPESIKSKIFDPFFSTKGVGKGTGQGLSIAYNVIVDKHQGSISVDSQENMGTTFSISLPLNTSSEADQREPA